MSAPGRRWTPKRYICRTSLLNPEKERFGLHFGKDDLIEIVLFKTKSRWRVKISSGGNCDFISRLPDPILHHILGLLNIEEAVQTCVLSKRWEHLWTSLSSLNFHCDYDDSEAYGDEGFVKMEAINGRFAKFVNSLLMRRQSLDLDVFRLFCHQIWLGYEREWVHYAVNHNPRVLHLTLTRSVPWCVYTCSSLEELYLSDPGIYPSDLIVNLPKLRKLTICWSDLNSIYVKNLLYGCPILELLRLDSCVVRDCVIAHECLKHLAIENCHIIHEEHHLFINAPCLLSFLYEGDLSLPYKTTLNKPSLTSSCLTSFDDSADISLEGIATCLHFLTNIDFSSCISSALWTWNCYQLICHLNCQFSKNSRM
ncbi:putative F-box/LRR-repeat protein At5g02930 [Carex rostrata]